ncbi:MAG: CHAP domain-containing protein [Ktedonobacterales bacterium]|nr:CHAP domain-containing protein [Ktedonobacterales bacterium]
MPAKNATGGCLLSLLVIITLVVCLGAAFLIIPIAVFAGGGSDQGGATGGTGQCTPIPANGSPPGATPAPVAATPPPAPTPACSVVAWAHTIAAHLTMCGGHWDPNPALRAPDFDKCYTTGNATGAMPQAVVDFLQKTYPGDASGWASGNFQCVSLVIAAYGLAGLPMPYQGDAVTFWSHYRTLKEWVAIPAGHSPQPGTPGIGPGLPQPGDMLVWSHAASTTGAYDPGHIAIVLAVTPPTDGQAGSVTFAQANAFAPTASVPLTPQPDLNVLPWPGGDAYTALGFIRYLGPASRPTANTVHRFICAALPFARLAQQMELSNPGQGMPNPYPWERPLPHPWYVSVLLAQWGVEQGWHLPGYTGYNWGNSSAIPGFPTIGGTGQVGSPGQFAYANSAEQGVEIHTIFTKMGNYTSVAAAWPQGPLAQATALGQSPWDFSHYTADGVPGDSLTNLLSDPTLNLTRYDNQGATC